MDHGTSDHTHKKNVFLSPVCTKCPQFFNKGWRLKSASPIQGLISCGSSPDNHSCCVFISLIAISCLQDSISVLFPVFLSLYSLQCPILQHSLNIVCVCVSTCVHARVHVCLINVHVHLKFCLIVCICVCIYDYMVFVFVCVCVCCGIQKKESNAPEMGLQVVVRYQIWMLGTEFGSSRRPESTPNC